MTPTIAERSAAFFRKFSSVCAQHNRDPRDISLLLVTKTRSIAEIEQAVAQGWHHLGENRIEELETKVDHEFSAAVTWHYIGNLQSRAASRVVSAARGCVGGVWSPRTIDQLAQCPPTEVLLQVKIASEANKTGLSPDQVPDAVSQIQKHANISLRGVMGMATRVDESGEHSQVRSEFQLLRRIFDGVREQLGEPSSCDILSMGMSNDWEIAIAEGSTQLRIGQTIFGPRVA